MTEGQNLINAKLVFEGCDFHALSFLFFLSIYIYIERYGFYLSNATAITLFRPLQLKFYIKHRLDVKSINIRHRLKHDLNFISNLLFSNLTSKNTFKRYKKKLSRHYIYIYIYITWAKYYVNMGRTIE